MQMINWTKTKSTVKLDLNKIYVQRQINMNIKEINNLKHSFNLIDKQNDTIDHYYII